MYGTMSHAQGMRTKVSVRFLVVVWLSALYACQFTDSQQQPEIPHQLTPAFYHWKATYNPTRFEQRRLDSLNVRKLYVHFFDVDWDARTRQPVPKAFVRFRQKPAGLVVPVVFITNRTLVNLPPAQLPMLANNLTQAIRRIGAVRGIAYGEVQVDCDWSVSTRHAYFHLLTLLKRQLHCPLSATIRLHQVKFADRTGVPPVSRGMLMLYNVADWKRPDTRNSIYDPEVAGRYLPYVATYPLPLDVVLPLFRWTVVYRNGRFLTFLHNVDRKALARQPFLQPQRDSTRFVAQRDTPAFGFSVRRGDLFRVEVVSGETLTDLQRNALATIQNGNLTFALYHLDSTVLSGYPRETLHPLFQSLP